MTTMQAVAVEAAKQAIDQADELVRKLEYVNDEIKWRRAQAEIVEDVINQCVLSKAGSMELTNARIPVVQVKDDGTEKTAYDVYRGRLTGQLKYLPQGSMEEANEYDKRLSMTPESYETPSILNDRQGALFSTPPKLEGDDAEFYKEFANDATRDGKSLVWVIHRVAELMDRNGFCGVLVDHEELSPEDQARMAEKSISAQEVQDRKLGRVILSIYEYDQILDYAFDAQGLAWVKVQEGVGAARQWDDKGSPDKIIRVIGRENIRTWKITKDASGKRTATEQAKVPHDWRNARGQRVVPFRLVASPMSQRNGLGASLLLGSARMDVSAISLISDVRWILFLYGQPLFWAKLIEARNIVTGAGRYLMLKSADGLQKDSEEVGYAQLDTAGLEMMYAIYKDLKSQAKELGGQGGDGAVTVPVEESGIARAWKFKTGEERILFLITNALSRDFNWIMDIVAVSMKKDPEQVALKFNENFANESDGKELESAEKVLSIAESYDLEVMAKLAIRKAALSLEPMPDADRDKLNEAIQGIDFEARKAEKQAQLKAMQQANGEPPDGEPNLDGAEDEA